MSVNSETLIWRVGAAGGETGAAAEGLGIGGVVTGAAGWAGAAGDGAGSGLGAVGVAGAGGGLAVLGEVWANAADGTFRLPTIKTARATAFIINPSKVGTMPLL